MKSLRAVNDFDIRDSSETLRCGELGIDIPKGHVGPVHLSGTGRTVWWTGRVAIGLRYEPLRERAPAGESALWIQNVLLRAA